MKAGAAPMAMPGLPLRLSGTRASFAIRRRTMAVLATGALSVVACMLCLSIAAYPADLIYLAQALVHHPPGTLVGGSVMALGIGCAAMVLRRRPRTWRRSFAAVAILLAAGLYALVLPWLMFLLTVSRG